MFAVITLGGEACGAVISVERLSENDYVAICNKGGTAIAFMEVRTIGSPWRNSESRPPAMSE